MSQQPQPYMVDHKRGEVNELKALLSNPKLQKEPLRKREVIKKVIAYMTLGIDVSRLFSEMVMACYTRDVIQKKLIYSYLCYYAQQKPDIVLLAINTLQKDCRDEDPMVRGLALRSLSSLRVANLPEYVMVPLRNCLTDASPYVRKTACVGVAKVGVMYPDVIRNSDLIDVLYNMLRDRDSQVIVNVIYALNEVLAHEGGMAINSNIVQYLLTRIREFSEWGQCAVLDLISRYSPSSDDEMFDIMNLLEDRLKHANVGVVLGTTKIFLNFTVHNEPLHVEVYRRLKAPMLTLMGASNPEISYSILAHIQQLVIRQPHVFSDSYKEFFCRFNDPSSVKKLKLSIITNLCSANINNQTDILAEIAEYVTDSDIEIGRYAIESIGKIAVQVPDGTDEACEHLISFLDLNLEHVTSQTLIVLKDVLRKYPDRYEEIIPHVHKACKGIEETDGKVAVLWMIGEYGEIMDDSPYLVEPYIDNYAEETSGSVRMELLTASMKLFFKRPPEMKAMLGRLLKKAVDEQAYVDVRDRALLYYRLLLADVHEAARVVNCPQVAVDVFVEEHDDDTRAKIFAEFDSLSCVYNLPSERFIRKLDDEERRALDEAEEAAYAAAQAEASYQNPDSGMLSHYEGQTPSIPLASAFTIDKSTYASKWSSLEPLTSVEMALNPQSLSSATLEASFANANIHTFASGVVDQTLKLYLYAKDANSEALFLTEAIISLQTGQFQATIKADDPNNATAFASMLQYAAAAFSY
jgi:AP-4 complex subunit beta-1